MKQARTRYSSFEGIMYKKERKKGKAANSLNISAMEQGEKIFVHHFLVISEIFRHW